MAPETKTLEVRVPLVLAAHLWATYIACQPTEWKQDKNLIFDFQKRSRSHLREKSSRERRWRSLGWGSLWRRQHRHQTLESIPTRFQKPGNFSFERKTKTKDKDKGIPTPSPKPGNLSFERRCPKMPEKNVADFLFLRKMTWGLVSDRWMVTCGFLEIRSQEMEWETQKMPQKGVQKIMPNFSFF